MTASWQAGKLSSNMILFADIGEQKHAIWIVCPYKQSQTQQSGPFGWHDAGSALCPRQC